MTNKTQQITQSALFMALGILIPVLFHSTGLGAVFLPMFWPMAIGAFFLPPGFIVITGLFTPLLSMLLTGMPPFPLVFILMIEITVMMITIYFTNKHTLLGVLPVLVSALIISRASLFLCMLFLSNFLGITGEWLSWASVVKGAPGILTMLLFIPVLIHVVKKEALMRKKSHV